MALKLDDLLVKKKEPVQILDLSKSTANSKEELKKLMEKVPEYKIKMDKVRPDEVKVYDRKFSFKTCKSEGKTKSFPFANPIPSEMKSLRLEDLCSVNIQWKMLTSLRPKNKMDEEYFSKLIELGKLQLQAREKERKKPFLCYVKKSKNKAGITETRIISCRDCGEEFCIGETCKVFSYDAYERSSNLQTTSEEVAGQEKVAKEKKKRKRKKKKITKKKIPPSNKKIKSKQITQNISKSENSNKLAQTKKHKPSFTANKLKKNQQNNSKGRNKNPKNSTISNNKTKKTLKTPSKNFKKSSAGVEKTSKTQRKSNKSKKK